MAQEPLASRVLRHRDILLKNVRQAISESMGRSTFTDPTPLTMAINERLIDRHPDLFIHQPMTGPVDLVNGRPVTAISRQLGARYACNPATSDSSPSWAEDELINTIVDEFAYEFRYYDGAPRHFYVPIMPPRAAPDPMTFQPMFTFRTRYVRISSSR
jgi:hypothetical protein